MKDGIVRIVLKRIALICFTLDLRASRRIRRAMGETSYRLGGRCQGCAKCCEAPTIQVGILTYRLVTFRMIFLAWHRWVNGFHLTGEDPQIRAFEFRCTHFDPKTRRCDSYTSRPGMCRDYPRALLWEANPPLFPECGYRAVAPNAEQVTALLEHEDLPPEKLEELKEKLMLKDE